MAMKTAISIDDKLFEKAESFSRSFGLSRSRLYSTAINEYIQNHDPDLVTEKLNSYYKNHSSHLDDDVKEAAYNLFAGEDW
jgi:metal-responsive CopG/Arc/MetJ family transcriptional regulator